MIEYIFIVNALIFLMLSITWSGRNVINLFIKMILIILTGANMMMALQGLGFVFKNVI